MVAPFTVLIGRSARSAICSGVSLSWIVYCSAPIFANPPGVCWVWAAMALETSWADRPRACRAAGSSEIITWRALPPNGCGIATPGTLTSAGRMVFWA